MFYNSERGEKSALNRESSLRSVWQNIPGFVFRAGYFSQTMLFMKVSNLGRASSN